MNTGKSIPEYNPLKVPLELAGALDRLRDERGLPNAIGPKELHEHYGGPYPFDLGWHYRFKRAAIDAACALRGVRIVRIYKPANSTLKMIELESTHIPKVTP